MKVCILAFSHLLDSSRIFSKEALSLVKGGHDVFLIARNHNDKSTIGEDCGVRYLAYPRRPVRTPQRLLQDPLFMIKMIVDAWKADAEVYHCHEPQSLLVGLLIARLRGRKVVYDCHEFQPEATAEHFGKVLYPLMKRIFRTFERFVVRQLDGVITVNDRLVKRFRKDCDWVISLPNYPLKAMFNADTDPPRDMRRGLEGKKVLIYIGRISAARGITTCLHMISSLKEIMPNIFMLFIGRVNREYHQIINEITQDLDISDQVRFLGQVDSNEIPSYLKLANLGIFLVQPVVERYQWGEPIKFFEYAGAGLPVVLSDLPAKRKLIEDTENGILVDPYNHRDIASLVANLLVDNIRLMQMRQRGLQAFQSRYNWEAVEGRLMDFYGDLV